MSNGLGAVARALVAFSQEQRRFEQAFEGVAVDRRVVERIGDLAEDLLTACELLLESHTAAVDASDLAGTILSESERLPAPPEEVRESSDPDSYVDWLRSDPDLEERAVAVLGRVFASLEITTRPHARVKIAFKYLFLVIRALQDGLYAAFLAASGETPGKYTSMSKGFRQGKPMSELLAESYPEYIGWFEEWREMRNRVKDGVGFEVTTEPDLGIVFAGIHDDMTDAPGENQQRVDATDVARAIEASAHLMTVIADFSQDRRRRQ